MNIQAKGIQIAEERNGLACISRYKTQQQYTRQINNAICGGIDQSFALGGAKGK
jgi:hypothetical protein